MSPSPSAQRAPIASSASPRVGVGADYFSPHVRRGALNPAVEATKILGGGREGGGGGSGKVAVRGLTVMDHGEFLERWGETEMTRVRDGSNPMLDSYRNAAFIL